VSYRYDYTGQRVVKETSGPKGNHRTVYVDRLAEERNGEAVDYVFAGKTRVARLGGESPVPSLASASVRQLPPVTGAAALFLLAFAVLASLLRATRFRPRSLVALGTACALFSVTTAGCGSCGGQALTGPAGAAVHYHGDHLGGVALLTSPDGSVAGEVSYDPWGAQLAGSTEPYAFTGKEYEADVGLYDFGARIYDAGIGRFLSPDPEPLSNPGYGLGDPQRLNPYSYVRNSPTVYVDPTGRYLESPLDAAFVIIDIASYVYHTVKGDTRAAQIDTLAFIADMACLATPVATGGGLLVRGGARSEQILLHAGTEQSGKALIKAEQVGARGQTATARAADDWPQLSGMLRDAAKGKGNFGVGSATREQAEASGRAWVGPNSRVASDGNTLVSRDGLRVFRPPSNKPRLGKTQANFEQKTSPDGRPFSNAHLDIIEP
jgi:RHS repeat-associated protein